MDTGARWRLREEGELTGMLKRLAVRARHPLRALAMAMAALALAYGIAGTGGIVAAMIGAIGGVIAGELIGRSKLRLPIALGAIGLSLLVLWELSAAAVTTELVPELLGPGTTLGVVGVIRYGALALAIVAALRTLAVRKPTAMALELAFIAAAFTAAVATHRDGVIARPLWLSDWAWQAGFDPAHVLIAIGAGSVVLLAILLITERKEGLSLASLIVLLSLALLALLTLNAVGMPTPTAANDLGLNDNKPGEEPHPPPPDAGRGPQPGSNDGGVNPTGTDGGSGSGGGDGGADPASGLDGGTGQGNRDGGGGGGGRDGGADGGGGGAGADGGGSNGAGGDGGAQQQQQQGGDGGGQSQQQQQGGDGGQQQQQQPRPPDEQLENEDQGPSSSPAPMAVVLLDNDYSPPSQAYYFRQESWSEYNGTRLIATTRDDADTDLVDDFPTYRTPVPGAPPAFGRTRVDATVALVVEHTHPFGLETPTSFAPAPNPNSSRFIRAYRFRSLSQSIAYRRLLHRTGGDSRWSPELRQYYLQGPTDPRYRELAERIVHDLPPHMANDPFAKALAVKVYLDRELIYSTRHRHLNVPDPTADFLFGNKTGYCVHFAHAAVFLWRALGIPARVSAGYHSDEDNRRGGSTILLRANDAHAWPELYLDGIGWIVLDISAARNLDPPGTPPDDDLQRLLGEMARNQPPNPMEQPKNREKPYQHYGRDIGIAALVLLLLALLALYGIKISRRLAPGFANSKTIARVGYRKALDLLGEAGLVRQFGEPREAFAKRVVAQVPSFERVTAMHLAAKLGHPATDPVVAARPEHQVAPWREALRALSRELPKKTKLWRRLLGLIHPASFLDSR